VKSENMVKFTNEAIGKIKPDAKKRIAINDTQVTGHRLRIVSSQVFQQGNERKVWDDRLLRDLYWMQSSHPPLEKVS